MNSILITGASSEIGIDLLKKLSEDPNNHLLCHCFHNSLPLEQLAAKSKAKISILPGDFSTTKGITDWVASAVQVERCPNSIIFLAAPPLKLRRFREGSIEEMEAQLRVQVVSAAETLRIILPEMQKAKRGKVVFLLSSVISGRAPSAMASYVSAKSALHGLYRAVSAEYRDKGLHFHAISPGLVKTKYLANFPPRLLELEAEGSARGRLLEPSDLTPHFCKFLEDDTIPSGEVHVI